MKTLLILAVSFLLTGCGPSAPKFPTQIKNYYSVLIPEFVISNIQNLEEREKSSSYYKTAMNHFSKYVINMDKLLSDNEDATEIACLHFTVETHHPLKIKYQQRVPQYYCNLVGGFKPSDTQLLFSWIDDIWDWAKEKKVFSKWIQ